MTALFLARPLPGIVGERRRVCHVFPVSEGDSARLVALCGAEFARGDLEQLNAPQGMPCERCLAHAPSVLPAGDDVTDRLDRIDVRLAEIAGQVESLLGSVGNVCGARLFVARPQPTSMGERGRRTHVFAVLGAQIPARLIASCGQRFTSVDLDRLTDIRGEACRDCLPNPPAE